MNESDKPLLEKTVIINTDVLKLTLVKLRKGFMNMDHKGYYRIEIPDHLGEWAPLSIPSTIDKDGAIKLAEDLMLLKPYTINFLAGHLNVLETTIDELTIEAAQSVEIE